MSLSPKLLLRQSQSLVMTPQLLQAIKLLQLSHLDLIAYVEEELERNPLLERDDRSEPDDGPAPEAPSEGGADEWMDGGLATSGESLAAELDTDLSNVYPADEGSRPADQAPQQQPDNWSEGPSRQSSSTEAYDLEAFVASEKTLAQHLGDQLGVAVADPQARLIGQAIIDGIDEAGYFRGDVAEIAERLGTTGEEVLRLLAIVQSFEPSGIGARNLAECLKIQLRDRDRLDPAMEAMVDHLELMARRDLAGLQRVCGVDAEDIAAMTAEIRALSPKPGATFGAAAAQPIVPDVLLRAAPDGTWLLELNGETLPRLLVQQSYYARVVRNSRNATDKSYLAEHLQSANWLVKSLDQRARTILKVATEIVRQQDAFFAHGVQHLRPLNLKSIADAIGMHESTVSRVTSNKYITTPRGTFELKYFFTAAIASARGGEAHSAEAVRHRIKTLIDGEPKDGVLSDDTIVQVLRDGGVDIARRTVAKYREAMRIPSSVQRRRDKQLDATP
jgi:RNA polymerase sigma-54 factor